MCLYNCAIFFLPSVRFFQHLFSNFLGFSFRLFLYHFILFTLCLTQMINKRDSCRAVICIILQLKFFAFEFDDEKRVNLRIRYLNVMVTYAMPSVYLVNLHHDLGTVQHSTPQFGIFLLCSIHCVVVRFFLLCCIPSVIPLL